MLTGESFISVVAQIGFPSKVREYNFGHQAKDPI